MITIATYNILHGLHGDMIAANIQLLIKKGADVICLQEVDCSFEDKLNDLLPGLENWHVQYTHTERGGDLAVLWNNTKVNLQSFEMILLPILAKPALSQRIRRSNSTVQRAAFVCNFNMDNKLLRITNVHLAWEGGIRQRLTQIKHINKYLISQKSDYDVIAGDFNILPMIRSIEEKKIQDTLGPQYINALPDIAWTFDISRYIDPEAGILAVTRLCQRLGITLRSRLDYIWTRNLSTVSGEMLDLSGSDHRPLIGVFKFL